MTFKEISDAIMLDHSKGTKTWVLYLPELLEKYAVDITKAMMAAPVQAEATVLWDGKTTVQLPYATSGTVYHVVQGAVLNEYQNRVYGKFDNVIKTIKKCECGASAIGVMKHSSYCALHEGE